MVALRLKKNVRKNTARSLPLKARSGVRALPITALALAVGLVLFLGAGPAAAGSSSAPTVVGSNSTTAFGTTVVVTLTAPVPVNSTILVAAGLNRSQVGPVTGAVDSGLNTYAVDASVNNVSGKAVGLLRAPVTTALSIGSTVTVTFGGGAATTLRSATVFYVQGLLTASPVDGTVGTGTGNSASAAATTAGATTNGNDFVAGAVASGTVSTGNNSCTELTAAGTGGTMQEEPVYKTTTSNATQTCGAAVTSGQWAAVTASYKVDVTNPTAAITESGSLGQSVWTGAVHGSATDEAGGSGIDVGSAKTQLSIHDDTANSYWSDSSNGWGATGGSETYFNPTTGPTAVSPGTAAPWSYNFASSNFTPGHTYTVHAKTTDYAGNVSAVATSAITWISDVSVPAALASSTGGGANSTTHVWTATVTANVPVGATVFIAASETNLPSSGSFSATDSAGNTYTVDKAQVMNEQVALLSSNVTHAMTSGSTTISVTFPGTVANSLRHVFTAFYVTGLRTSGVDQTGTANTAGGSSLVSVTSGSPLAQSGEFVVASWGENQARTITPGSSCAGPTTPVASGTSLGVGYLDKTVTSTTAQTCSGTLLASQSWAAVIGTYKVDVTNPNAPAITFPSASYYGPNSWTTIAGTASDDAGGSGIASDSVQIKDNTNSTYWNGASWQAGPTSNAATGTTSWTYALASANLTTAHNYTVSVTSTDNAANVSSATTKSFTYDSAPPVYASSATNTLGTQVTLTYTESGSGLNTGITPATSAFTVTGCSASCSVTNVSVASSTTVVLTLASRIYGGASPTVAYTQPGSNKLQDNAGNLAATLSAQSVTDTATASLAQSTVSASPNPIISDGSTASTITVQLKNAAGTNLTSSGGTVTVSTNLGTFPSSCTSNCATTDNGNGTYTATLTSTSAGTATISAKLDGSSLTNTASLTINLQSFVTNTAVSINGTPTVGTASSLTAGSYTPSPTGSSYQWRLCDSSGASCADIGGATASTYTPVAGDVGSTLRVVETVTKAGYNNGGSTSAASPVVINGSFVTNTAVAINGTPTVGTASTLTAGSYTPSPTGTSYQWRLCNSVGASCADIGGATSSTYTPVAGDVGGTLRVVETVTKAGYNNGTSTSAASPVVINGDFTTNTAVAINGTPTVGTASSLTAGSYTPSPTGTSYQWRLCDSSGASCADIGGATASTYTPVAGDVGGTLRVVETVTRAGYNNGGSTSAASPVVINGDFVTNTPVSINGTPTVGTATTVTNGVYTPVTASRTYQWRLCDAAGANCSDISGATGHTYTPVAGDVGSTLRVVETAIRPGYNNGGSTSAPSPVVINGDFVTNTAVAINGTPTVGTASSLTAGSYTPSPTGASYQWRLCDSSGASCADISGATSSTYTPVAGDVGGTLRVVETVTAAGYNNGTSTSAASPVVINGDFTTNTAVAINGTPTVDTASTLTAGSYTPTPTGTSYQWRLCNSVGASCADIGGATSSTYTPVAGDVGGTLRVVETVTKAGYNNGGSTSAASPVVVKASFTTNTGVSVSGTPTVGTSFTATAGSYTPAPTGVSYQWQLCDSGGGSCANIGGATSISYTPVAGDVGGTLKVVETVTRAGYNDGGSTSAASALVIKGSFTTSSAVVINGTPVIGTPTTITNGVYSPTTTSRSYQWELCDSSGGSCSNIFGATSNAYTPVPGDLGSTLRVIETVSRAGLQRRRLDVCSERGCGRWRHHDDHGRLYQRDADGRYRDDDHRRDVLADADFRLVSMEVVRQRGQQLRGHRRCDLEHVHAGRERCRLDVARRRDGVEERLRRRRLDVREGARRQGDLRDEHGGFDYWDADCRYGFHPHRRELHAGADG